MGKSEICAVSWKRLIVERKCRKFGTRGTTMHIYTYVGYIWSPIPLVWFGVILCTLQHFLFYDFRNPTPSTIFIRFPLNFMQGIIIRGWYRLLHFFGNLPKIKNSMALWSFCQHRTTWGWKFQNATTPTVFIWCQSNFMRALATMVEYRVSLFLAIGQVLKILWHFEILR